MFAVVSHLQKKPKTRQLVSKKHFRQKLQNGNDRLGDVKLSTF